MTPERWWRITEVFHLARTRGATGRAALLEEVCADDVALRAEVEAMLAADAAAADFGETPVLPAAEATPQFEPGACLGPYHIKVLIGAGGMGEVYRAHDTRLDRDVAIKVLSAAISASTDAPLLREARSAASLNHPHICTIYEVGEADGRSFIAMELVDGKPLDQLIPAGGLPVDHIVRYGLQIADAIAHAHERGIVHRDLKPANAMIADSGIAKVLDFGLAKVLPFADRPELESTASRSVTGMVGTAAYMSPEQILGRRIDERSDIFSFGGVLYEMATGGPAFIGDTRMGVLAAVVHARPEPVLAIRRDLPANLSQVIDKALAKDPRQRYQQMSKLTADLRGATLTTSRVNRFIRAAAVAASITGVAALAALGVPAVLDKPSIDDTTSRRETRSLPAYRAITEARGLYAAGRWEAALELTRRALDLDADYADAWALLGKLYIRWLASPTGYHGGSLEDFRAQAMTAARRAIELDPSSYDGYVALAITHREMGQIDEWRTAAHKAIALNPRLAEAYEVLGQSYVENPLFGCGPDRDSSRALSYYRRAFSIDPAPHVQGLMNSLRYAGEVEEALRVAEEGLRRYPTNRRLRRAVTVVLIDVGRIDEAERVLREAIADGEGGSRPDDEMQFARIELRRGRLAGAADAFRKSLPIGGHSRRSIHIARYYLEAGLPRPALEYLEPIVRAEPACAQWLLTTASRHWSIIRANREAHALLKTYNARAQAP
jgi:tetratricopeptide (TPR) repeat protein